MEPIAAFDLQRMLFGDESPVFLLEIIFRTLIVYFYALLLLRWLGSRTIGQLSTIEFLLVIALGSAVGDAMFYPDVPLVHALLVVTVVVIANKLLDVVIARNKAAERLLDGVPKGVIIDGVIERSFLNDVSLGGSELFQQLRHHGVEHLGQVARAYIEPDGVLTVFRDKADDRPGLPIAPPWEIEPPVKISALEATSNSMLLACRRCGQLHQAEDAVAPGNCPNCAHDLWTPARVHDAYRDD